jgi:predicted AAA+ superfamily ATPase
MSERLSCRFAHPANTTTSPPLIDTLIGQWLPAWRPRARIKEVQHPKSCLYDPGVVRAILGWVRDPLEAAERGPLLESLVFHELRAAMNEQSVGGALSYWARHREPRWPLCGSEVKASTTWRREFGSSLVTLREDGTLASAYGVYLGRERLRDRGVTVLPLVKFMRVLAADKVLG